jgi:predicted hydrocarbon binding protein
MVIKCGKEKRTCIKRQVPGVCQDKEGLLVANIFEENSHSNFAWSKLGDIKAGRPNMGDQVPVLVYRVLEYSMFDVLAHKFGLEQAQEVFRAAGHKAGTEFAHHVLDLQADLETFVAQLAEKLLALKMGVVRVEKLDREDGSFVITVGEDLDCSGLPVTGEVVCNYDEGFLAGVAEAYNNKAFQVREIDCWASGDRVCRFAGKPVQ